jgi:8-oxo-dGTP diphosphatase
MWESDHEWLPMVFDEDPRTFHGVMPYRDGAMVSWHYRRV